MDAEPDGQVEDDADDRGGDRRQGGGQQPLAAQRLDVGRPEEDPEEAGHEGDPGGQRGADDARRHRVERAGMAEGAHEATNGSPRITGPGRRSAKPQPLSIPPGSSHAVAPTRCLATEGTTTK